MIKNDQAVKINAWKEKYTNQRRTCAMERIRLTLNDGSIAQSPLHPLPRRQVLLLVDDHHGGRTLVPVGGGVVVLGHLPVGQIADGIVDALVDAAGLAGIEKVRPGLRHGRREGGGRVARLVQQLVGSVVAGGRSVLVRDILSVLGLGAVDGVAEGLSAAAGARRFVLLFVHLWSRREVSPLDDAGYLCIWPGKTIDELLMPMLRSRRRHWSARITSIAIAGSSITYAGRRIPSHGRSAEQRTRRGRRIKGSNFECAGRSRYGTLPHQGSGGGGHGAAHTCFPFSLALDSKFNRLRSKNNGSRFPASCLAEERRHVMSCDLAFVVCSQHVHVG